MKKKACGRGKFDLVSRRDLQKKDGTVQTVSLPLRSCLIVTLLLISAALALLARPAGAQSVTGQLELSWTDTNASGTVTGFIIQRKGGSSGTYAQVAVVPAATFSYTDATLTAGTTYCYEVLAYDADNTSPPSNELCAPVPTPSDVLTVSVSGGGTVTSSPAGITCTSSCSASFNAGTIVSLAASPSSGFTFSDWGDACSGAGTCNVSMNQSQSVTATFAASAPPPPPITVYTLSVTKGGTGNGSVSSSPGGINCTNRAYSCSAGFASGSLVSLTAVPISNSIFAGWTGACAGSGVCAVTMDQSLTVGASFLITKSNSGKKH